MKKKSQVSVFIIIGVLIVIIGSIFIFLNMRTKEIQQEDQFSMYADKTLAVRSLVEDCLSSELDNALEYVSLQGGYVYRPELSLERDYYNIAYDYYLGINFLPNTYEIENQEIDVYLNEYMPRCIKKTGLLEREEVAFGTMSIKTSIEHSRVLVEMDYPIKVITGEEEEQLSEFAVKRDVPLGMMVDTAHSIIEHIKDDPNWIDIGYLESLNLDVEVIHIDKNTIIYKLNDPFIDFRDDKYFFMFGALYNENSPPDLFSFTDYTLRLGDTLEVYPYAVDFNDDTLEFSSSSNMVNVDSATGLIVFTPNTKGEFSFNIKVDDGLGLYDEEELKVKVI